MMCLGALLWCALLVLVLLLVRVLLLEWGRKKDMEDRKRAEGQGVMCDV